MDKKKQIEENAVVLTREEYDELKQCEEKVKSGACFTQKEWLELCDEECKRNTENLSKARQLERKETAEMFAYLRKYITEQFHKYNDILKETESKYKNANGVEKEVINNDLHRAHGILFILEKVGIKLDEICEEITEDINDLH